jgi:hypothetical protein
MTFCASTFRVFMPRSLLPTLIMAFPLNSVVLRTLAQCDLFATLALANTSKTFHNFIYDNVIGVSELTIFLRKNQYALHHDAKSGGKFFSKSEINLLLHAFRTLERSQCASLYQKALPFLGVLMEHLPYWNFFCENELPDDWFYLVNHDRITKEDIEIFYCYRLVDSWMHDPLRFTPLEGHLDILHSHHGVLAQVFLNGDFLFCSEYVSDLGKCMHLARSWYKEPYTKYEGPRKFRPPRRTAEQEYMVAQISIIRAAAKAENLSHHLEKQCLTGYIIHHFEQWDNDDSDLRGRLDIKHQRFFRTMFDNDRWSELWDKVELGAWYAYAISKWGHDWLTDLLDKAFGRNDIETLLLMFLGAHRWGDEILRNQVELHDGGSNGWRCCQKGSSGETKFISEKVSGLSGADKISLIRGILRRAPEDGVCPYLGAHVLKHIICSNTAEFDHLLSIFLDEIIGTKLQYVFELSLSAGIVSYETEKGKLDLELPLSTKYLPDLVKQDLRLVELLSHP